MPWQRAPFATDEPKTLITSGGEEEVEEDDEEEVEADEGWVWERHSMRKSRRDKTEDEVVENAICYAGAGAVVVYPVSFLVDC